jgi:hypothetical protein
MQTAVIQEWSGLVHPEKGTFKQKIVQTQCGRVALVTREGEMVTKEYYESLECPAKPIRIANERYTLKQQEGYVPCS